MLKTIFLILFRLLFSFSLIGASQTVFAQLSVTPTSWNVIGLDSNNTNTGPDTFPVGVRICNTSGSAINNVTGAFIWDSTNTYINLEGSDTANLGSLAAGTCTDLYFMVKITRTSAAYDTTRRYRITVAGDSATTVSTPSPRELYVERLVSQNRNAVNSLSGSSAVLVGQTYTYTLNASTATNGYEQLEAFVPFPASIFQVLSISTTYSAPTGATNNKFYADACGWDNVPTSGTYRSCIGPVQYTGGKAGGTMSTTYTVRVIGTGAAAVSSLIYDFSGSSYHYNSDYGAAGKIISIVATNPPDLTIAKSHTGNFVRGQTDAQYNLTVTNTGGSATSGTVTVTDTLPTGLTPTAPTGSVNGWTCNIAGQVVTCSRSNALAVSASYPVIPLTVSVATAAPSSVTNTATVSGGGESNTSNNSSSDPTTIVSPPNVTLVKTVTPGGSQSPGTELTYSIEFTNDGGLGAQVLVIIDPIPENTDFKVGSTVESLGSTGLTMVAEYSNDYTVSAPGSATWTYTPVSAGGGADSGYDRLVKAVRWRATTGTLSPTPPDHTGTLGFTVRIR